MGKREGTIMAIIYTSSDLPDSYGGYTNSAWGTLMNTYGVRFTGGDGEGDAYEGITFNFSVTVNFPWAGTYTVRAAADNFGSLTVAGNRCTVSGFNTAGVTTFFANGGNQTVSGSVRNGSGSNYATNPYAIAFTIDAPDEPPRPNASLSADPTTVIVGGSPRCSTLTWSSSGGDTFTLTDVNNPGASGTAQVCPTSTKTYTFEATNAGGSDQDSVEIIVYTRPSVTISANPGTSIIAGNSVTIEWSTSGDADNFVWTQGGISNTNLTSSSVVSPTVTTTYSGYATGLGGTSPVASITVTVYQLPSLTVDYPTSLDYGTQGIIEYTSNYVNSSLTLTPTYYYLDDVEVTGNTVNLSKGDSAESGVGTTEVTDTYTTTIPYTDRGPISVAFVISGSGDGGPVASSANVPIIVDLTPENLNIIESEDLLANQEPVVTPDTDVLTEQYLIDDIDIDVEVKANYPIQVQLNNSGTWENVREI